MNEIDPLEKQLQNWTPRQPSSRISEQLFGEPGKPKSLAIGALDLRFWNWATPVAACCAALFLTINSKVHSGMGSSSDNSSYYATVLIDSGRNSNSAQHTFALNKSDVNLENNVWSRTVIVACNEHGNKDFEPRVGIRTAVTNRYD